ncbi:MAG TPA: DUF6508 domain-containing protein [Anaerolineales bacterium]
MKNNELPTRKDIEELTAYLPRLYAEGFTPVLHWNESEKRQDGSFSMPYPDYHPLVHEFFRLGGGPWIDYEYNPEKAYQMLKDEQAIRTASLSQIKSMLTYCVRGERFSDGHWEEMIEKGYIRRILERLNEIKLEMK